MLRTFLRHCVNNRKLFETEVQGADIISTLKEGTWPPLYVKQFRKQSSLHVNAIPNLVNLEAAEQDMGYMSAYTDIVDELTKVDEGLDMNEAKQRLARVLKHSLPYGRYFEGYGVVSSYKLLESPENLTEENVKLANILGWCSAMICAATIIQDDIMDGEETRKGLPCWHRLDNIGLSAINDSLLIENTIYRTLKRHFSNHQCYLPIMELFHDIVFETGIGQSIDLMSMVNGKPRFEVFTRERVRLMSINRAALICYKLPLTLALHLSGKFDPVLYKQATSLMLKIGYIFLVHNDVQDGLGKATVVGKRGTDIRNGKCSWLAVEALQRGTPAQKKLFMQHYGIDSDESEQIVLNLYHELRLSEVYKALEKESFKLISDDIEKVSHRLPREVFYNMMTDVSRYSEGYY